MLDDVKGGFPVFLRSFGHGSDTALLLHCALAHSKAWHPLAGLLADRLSMIAPDMPGHGRSAEWDHRCDIHDQVTAIAKDCLDGPSHVVGHSFGATIALRLALECPEFVQSLTLIEPVLFAAARESDPDELQRYLTFKSVFADALKAEDWETSAREFVRVWGDGRSWDSLSEREQKGFARQMHFIRDTETALLNDTPGLLGEGRLESVRCPTLLVRGGESHPVMQSVHATFLRRIPDARDVVIPGAGHMVPITHPEPVASEISTLINAL